MQKKDVLKNIETLYKIVTKIIGVVSNLKILQRQSERMAERINIVMNYVQKLNTTSHSKEINKFIEKFPPLLENIEKFLDEVESADILS